MRPSDADLTRDWESVRAEAEDLRAELEAKVAEQASPDPTAAGLPSRSERFAWAAASAELEEQPALAPDLEQAAEEADASEQEALETIDAGAGEEKVAAALAQSIRRSSHVDQLRRTRRRLPDRLVRHRCGARARASRPAPARSRGSRRGASARSGPDDDSGGEPEPPWRRPCPHDLSAGRQS